MRSTILPPPQLLAGRGIDSTHADVRPRGSEEVGKPASFFEVTTRGVGRRHAGTYGFAIFVEPGRHVTLDAVIYDPVIAAVGIHPDAGLKIAQGFGVNAAVAGLVGADRTG